VDDALDAGRAGRVATPLRRRGQHTRRAPGWPETPGMPPVAAAGYGPGMTLALTEEQELLRSTAADFVDSEVVPNRARWDRDELVDREIVGRLGELGFLGLTLPEEFGGTPVDSRSYCLLMEELGRGDSAIRGIVSVSLGLVGKSIAAYGSEDQNKQWLPGIASGETLACFGLTEPGIGSDAGNLTTRATRDGGDWLITGEKVFITNGTWAQVALVFARTGGPGPRGVTAFLVPTDANGFEAREIKGKLGLRGQATASLHLDEVRVPDANRLGDEGKGFRVAMSALDKGRMSIAAGCVGIARGCLEAATGYAKERVQFGKPIAAHQLVQELLADTAVDVDAARMLTWLAADLLDRSEPMSLAASKAKLFASEAAVRAANNCLQVFGGYGYIDEYPVGKYLRDARVMTLYEGTSQVQKLIIGRALTGISAF
jgi:alkylation response protein AidB-like acyl-CoA dehydrogenase